MFALVRNCIAIGFALAVLSSTLRAGVVVVQGGSLQAAIDAAAEGDVLLVSGGPYGKCSIVSKSLSIVADPAGSVTIEGISISGIATSQQCTFAGFVVHPTYLMGSVYVSCCSGSVRIESVRVEFPNVGAATAAVNVNNATDVAIVNCELHGDNAEGSSSSCCGGHSGGCGLWSIHSKVALYDSYLQGGPGESSFTVIGGNQTPAGPGGPGLRVQDDSIVLASNCIIEGGQGATGKVTCPTAPCTVFTQVPPGAGGDALSAWGLPSTAWLTDSVLVGGPGGSAAHPLSPCCTQPSGAAGSSSPGTANVLQAAHLVLAAPTHVREQTSMTLDIEGVPGDLVGLFVADGSAWQLDPASAGVLLQAPTTRRLVFGTILPSGAFPISVPVGALPPGIDAQTIRLQVISRAPSGAVRLGSPAVLTILDQAF